MSAMGNLLFKLSYYETILQHLISLISEFSPKTYLISIDILLSFLPIIPCLAEIMPRIIYHLDLLLANPDIKILVRSDITFSSFPLIH